MRSSRGRMRRMGRGEGGVGGGGRPTDRQKGADRQEKEGERGGGGRGDKEGEMEEGMVMSGAKARGFNHSTHESNYMAVGIIDVALVVTHTVVAYVVPVVVVCIVIV